MEWELSPSPLDWGSSDPCSGVKLSVWTGALHKGTQKSGGAEERFESRHHSSLSSPVLERAIEMPTTGESRDGKHETARDVNDTQLLTFLHNKSSSYKHTRRNTLELSTFSQVAIKHA